MSVREIDRSLEQWRMGVKDLRRRMILAPTPRVKGVDKTCQWGGAKVYHQRSLASVNVRASCSGEVSQRQAGSRLGG